ncbi:unnamed protein product [Albugo candida]|uniref:Uncharacterized protein n=1 Tax=Albugo candida TaxID=65357 RepID=A0A024FUE8_9STRA|nr:unnamed protein product [Albugo candida]|eukprot:CCI10512.1 unnamed protein product [Albugo candida]
MRKFVTCNVYLVFHLSTAMLVVRSEEKCPFEKALECSRSQFALIPFFGYSVSMEDNSKKQAKYFCPILPLRSRKLTLAPNAYDGICSSFYYYFNGDELRLSMDTKQSNRAKTIELTSISSKAWSVEMTAIKWGEKSGSGCIIFNIGYEKLMVPKAVGDVLQEEKRKNRNAKGSTTIQFVLSNKKAFSISTDIEQILVHDEECWIFGRTIMKQNEYIFYKDGASTYKIKILGLDSTWEEPSDDVNRNQHEQTEIEAIDAGNGKFPGGVEQFRNEHLHNNVDERVKFAWANEKVVESPDDEDYHRSNKHHSSRLKPDQGVMLKDPGLEDRVYTESGTEHFNYLQNQAGSSSSHHASYTTNPNAHHGSRGNSHLYTRHVDSNLNALPHSTTSQAHAGDSDAHQNQAGSGSSHWHPARAGSRKYHSTWWNHVEPPVFQQSGQQLGNEGSRSGRLSPHDSDTSNDANSFSFYPAKGIGHASPDTDTWEDVSLDD